jgi:tetratricopeptide (TPR) repeat protein
MGKLALARVRAWLDQTTSPPARTRALRFLSVAYFTFGQKVQAVETCQSAVDEWQRHCRHLKEINEKDRDQFDMELRNSLAYYLADIAESDAGQKIHAKDRAQRYLDQAKECCKRVQKYAPDQHSRAMLLDTEGAVKIACADNIGGVRQGLELCKRARRLLNNTVEDQEFRAFYSLHEIRAFQKIIDLEQKIASLPPS